MRPIHRHLVAQALKQFLRDALQMVVAPDFNRDLIGGKRVVGRNL